MITLLIAQIIINSYSFGTAAPAGGAGFIMQEDGSYLLQQDAVSKLKKEFSSGGFILQEDNFFLMQQNGTDKLQQQ